MTALDDRSGPLQPLGAVRAVEHALELREQDRLSYSAIAAVMARYHGVKRGPAWWRDMLRKRGTPPKHHGSQLHLRNGHLFKIDEAVLAAITDCPLTVLQLRYRTRYDVDRIDRSLQRLMKAGRVESVGAGLRRQWKPKP